MPGDRSSALAGRGAGARAARPRRRDHGRHRDRGPGLRPPAGGHVRPRAAGRGRRGLAPVPGADARSRGRARDRGLPRRWGGASGARAAASTRCWPPTGSARGWPGGGWPRPARRRAWPPETHEPAGGEHLRLHRRALGRVGRGLRAGPAARGGRAPAAAPAPARAAAAPTPPPRPRSAVGRPSTPTGRCRHAPPSWSSARATPPGWPAGSAPTCSAAWSTMRPACSCPTPRARARRGSSPPPCAAARRRSARPRRSTACPTRSGGRGRRWGSSAPRRCAWTTTSPRSPCTRTRPCWRACARAASPRWPTCPSARARRLSETLAAWLDERGNAVAVAARLRVHPQTVRYRLAQLRERFGDALEDADARFELMLAVRSGPAPGDPAN